MHFPRFWVLGKHGGCSAWGWSDSSPAEAESRGRETARRAAERLSRDEIAARRYSYGERPLREPVLVELKSPSGGIDGVVTRNSYGCLVLNAAQVMFIDVDLPPVRIAEKAGGWLKRLFGAPKDSPAQGAEGAAIARADDFAGRNFGWGWRVYRTGGGLRLLATHALFDAASAGEGPAFQELGADPLYRELCKAQKCFRARLTPKPWRCGIENPPGQWPFSDMAAERRFKDWESRYQRACEGKATCNVVAVLGSSEIHAGVREILALHDKLTGVESKLPLA